MRTHAPNPSASSAEAIDIDEESPGTIASNSDSVAESAEGKVYYELPPDPQKVWEQQMEARALEIWKQMLAFPEGNMSKEEFLRFNELRAEHLHIMQELGRLHLDDGHDPFVGIEIQKFLITNATPEDLLPVSLSCSKRGVILKWQKQFVPPPRRQGKMAKSSLRLCQTTKLIEGCS